MNEVRVTITDPETHEVLEMFMVIMSPKRKEATARVAREIREHIEDIFEVEDL